MPLASIQACAPANTGKIRNSTKDIRKVKWRTIFIIFCFIYWLNFITVIIPEIRKIWNLWFFWKCGIIWIIKLNYLEMYKPANLDAFNKNNTQGRDKPTGLKAEQKVSPATAELSQEPKGPLDDYFDKPGFTVFIDKLDEFENLDTSGENPADNARVREIFKVFEQYPQVVKGLQDFWQGKAAERKVTLSPESLKKIEAGIIDQINAGNLDIVRHYAEQMAEYKAGPERIKLKQEQIEILVNAYGSKSQLERQKRKGEEGAEEAQKKLEGLGQRREAKDVIDDNEQSVKKVADYAKQVLDEVRASQLAEVWKKLDQNPDLLISVIDSAEGRSALASVKKLEKIGNPIALIEQIKKDQTAVDDAEALGRLAQNLNNLLQLARNPEIQTAMNNFLVDPRTRRGIEDAGPQGASPTMLANREKRDGCEHFLGQIKTSEIKNIASTPDQMRDLLAGVEGLRTVFDSSRAGQTFDRLSKELRAGVLDLDQFNNTTLKKARETWNILGMKPGIAISEFFAKRNKKGMERKAEQAQASIETLQDAENEKISLQARFERARQEIFTNLPFAEKLIEDIGIEVDKKFDTMMADTASLKSYFEAASYFDDLLEVDYGDDDMDITAGMSEVEQRPGTDKKDKKLETKKALTKKVRQRMAKDIKTSVEGIGIDQINRGSLRKAFAKIRTGLGEAITANPAYREIELEAIKEVSKDPGIGRGKRKILESLIPKLSNPDYLGVAA